jgi:hypothetical protein
MLLSGGVDIDRESDAFFQMSESQLGDTNVVGTDLKEKHLFAKVSRKSIYC